MASESDTETKVVPSLKLQTQIQWILVEFQSNSRVKGHWKNQYSQKSANSIKFGKNLL